MLQFFDGFDTYGSETDLLTTPYYGTFAASFQTTGGRFGGGTIVSSGNAVGYLNLPSSLTELWTGRAVLSQASTGTGPFFYFVGPNLTISLNAATGQLVAPAGNTAIGSFTTNVWHYVECHYKSATTNSSNDGVLEIWVDNAQVYSTTASSYYGAVTSMIANASAATFGEGNMYTDDIYVLDTTGSALNTRLGDLRIGLALPDADASPNQGTPASGSSHYAMVDTSPGYNTADYISIPNTMGDEERFSIGSLPSVPAQVFAVSVVSVVSKSDAGGSLGVNEIVSNGTQSEGTAFPLSTTPAYYRTYYTTDPNTGAAWTVSAAEAIKIGFVVGTP
jgi:hypothetical protein